MGTLLFLIIFGAITAAIAHGKGRNPLGWFIVGFLTGIIGLIIVLVVSNLNEEQEFRYSVDRENRRLREQLRQERLKNEAARQYASRRLDAHDRALGMDTRPLLPEETANFPPAQMLPHEALESKAGQADRPPAYGPPLPHVDPERQWFYESGGETRGPVAMGVILRMLQSGQIRNNTLVWAEHLPDWVPAGHVPELRGHA